MPRIMMDVMLATTGNTTCPTFGMGHMCHKHNRLFTLDHVGSCDQLTGCKKIREYDNKLRIQHLLEWDSRLRLEAIAAFALLTIQKQNLTAQKEVTLVQTEPPQAYVKTGRGRGRPSNKEKIAKTNTTIN